MPINPSPIVWQNGATGNWTSSSDWVGGIVPASTSDVTVNGSASTNMTVYIDSPVTIASLTVNPNAAPVDISFHDTANLTVTGAITLNASGGSGQAAIYQTHSTLTAGSLLSSYSNLLYLEGATLNIPTINASSVYFSITVGDPTSSYDNTVNGNLTVTDLTISDPGVYVRINGNLNGTGLSSRPGVTAGEAYVNMAGGTTLDVTGSVSAVIGMDDSESAGFTGVIPPTTLQLDLASKFTGRIYVSSATDRVELTGASGNTITITPIADTVHAGTEGVQISGIDSSGAAFSFDMFNAAAGSYSAVFVDDGTGGKYVSLVQQTQGSTTWLNDAGGLWSNAANWSAGVPNASSAVTISGSTSDAIGSGHGFNITVSGTQSIASLSLDTVNPDQYGITLNVTGAVMTVSGAVSALAPAGWGVRGDGYHDARITLVGSTLTAASIAVYDLRIAGDGTGHSTSVINGPVTTGSPWDDYNGIYVDGNGTDAVINGSVAGLNGSAAGEAYIDISSGATLELNGAVTAGVFVSNFGGSSTDAPATLVIDHPSTFTGQVVTSSSKERVDLVGVAPGSLSTTLINRDADLALVNPTDINFNNLSAPVLGYRVSGVDGSGHAFSLDMFDEDLGVNRSGDQLAVLQVSDGHGGTYLSMGAPSVTATWVTDASGDWYTAASWVGGAVPGSTADVTITNDGTGDMRIGATAAVTANSLTINPDTIGGIVEATFSANLTLAGALTLETGDRKGAGVYFNQNGGTLSAQSISAHYTGMSVNSASLVAPTMSVGSLSFSGTTAKAVGAVTADVIEAGMGTSAVIDGSLVGYSDSSVSGEAYAYITNGGSLEITGSAAVHATLDDIGVQYKPASGTTLKLDKASAFTGYVVMTDAYDRVDVVGVAPGSLHATAVDGSSIGISGLYNNDHGVDVTGVDGAGNAISLDLFGWNTGSGTTAFNAVITSDGNGGSYVSLVPANLVTVAANTAVLVQAGKQYVGGGNDQFYVTPATIADTIDGGGNNSSLGVLYGGTSVMGANITGFGQVHLMGGTLGTTGFNFTANATQGLIVVGSLGNDVITVGDASQTIYTEGLNSVVKATAATAGALVAGVHGNPTLEISGGGTATLNANDGHGLIVQIDQAMILNMGLTAFISAVAETSGSTVTAGAPFQTLVTMAGGTTFIGATARNTYADTLQGTTTGLNGDMFVNFGKSDAIDITDVLPASSIVYTQTSTTQGSLAFGGASVTLQGSFNPAKFQMVTDGGSGTLVKYLG